MDKNIFWQKNKISAEERAASINQKGIVLWMTGLSGSGKSTIAVEVEKKLAALGFTAYLLDGDNIRHGLNSDLGFTSKNRNENVRRITEAAALMCDAQIIVLVCAISPYKAAREAAREKINFVSPGSYCEVYVNTPLEECIKRDTKGLYQKAVSGELLEFTGISSPYEQPLNPEIEIFTAEMEAETAADKIVAYILEYELDFYIKKITEFCVLTAIESGRKILEVYNKDFAVAYKDDNSPLTEADKASDDFIVKNLKEKFPEISILSEESRDDLSRLDNDWCFIVDPLDGTKEFVKKNGEFTVNIGLAYKGTPVAGVVFVPVQNKIYYASRNLGAYKQDLSAHTLNLFDGKYKIAVSARRNNLKVVKSRSHGSDALEEILGKNKQRIKEEIEVGSSLKGCYIADGTADVYYRANPVCEWDICAMHAVVNEAGGVFRELDGSEMKYNKINTLIENGFFILNNIENKF